jgi:hypothetical protein
VARPKAKAAVTFDLFLDGKLLAQQLTPASVENVVNLDIEDAMGA